MINKAIFPAKQHVLQCVTIHARRITAIVIPPAYHVMLLAEGLVGVDGGGLRQLLHRGCPHGLHNHRTGAEKKSHSPSSAPLQRQQSMRFTRFSVRGKKQ